MDLQLITHWQLGLIYEEPSDSTHNLKVGASAS